LRRPRWSDDAAPLANADGGLYTHEPDPVKDRKYGLAVQYLKHMIKAPAVRGADCQDFREVDNLQVSMKRLPRLCQPRLIFRPKQTLRPNDERAPTICWLAEEGGGEEGQGPHTARIVDAVTHHQLLHGCPQLGRSPIGA